VSTTGSTFVIVCHDYTSPPFKSRDAAEHRLAAIIEAGHCQLAHTSQVVPSP
jgi:hypothetical protein